MESEKKQRGRPTVEVTEEMQDEFCRLITTARVGMHRLLKDNGLPSWEIMFDRLNNDPIFYSKYARARDAQAEFLAAEINEVANERLSGKKTRETKDGTFVEEYDNVERAKLIVDAMKWTASKLKPKKYGNNTGIDLNLDQETIQIVKTVIQKRPDGEG